VLFNSLSYAVFFFVVLSIYWALPWHRARLGFLLIASWVFYLAWYPIYLLLFIAVTSVNYLAARAVAATGSSRPDLARRIVVAAVIVDLGNLALFKYYDFFLTSAAGGMALLTGSDWSPPMSDIFFPLGISFYSFQMMAYVIDVGRGEIGVIRNPLKMTLFIAFFPQLIAGPIVRAREFIGQLSSKRRFEARRFLHGLDLIAFGVFKKVLIADQLAPFVDGVFAAPDGRGQLALLLAMYAYSAQIYCDFSGYTDIGRGCAYCLGYELPRNFRAPYLSVNITEFWRRWHITLSNWLRDYLYIPLGGNRAGAKRTYVNLLITMVLGGLWHGTSWTFVTWGLLHGVALAVTRFAHERIGVAPTQPLFSGRLYRSFSMLVTFHFVSLAWIFFRAPTFDTAFSFLAGLMGIDFGSAAAALTMGRSTMGIVAVSLVLVGVLHAATFLAIRQRWYRGRAWAVGRPLVYFMVLVGVTLAANRGAQQFIYFQF
jgi:D-alanyl-lipoteichoic acid acyltransferase DltB (MBOAT superfamily)